MTRSTVNRLGWLGVLTIIVAYGLLSFNILPAESLAYQVLNVIGAFLIIIETAAKKDYQPMALNIVWSLIALISLLRIAFYL